MHCRVCPDAILSDESIFVCSVCKGTYHLACGGITENTYRRLTQERRSQQRCKQCKRDTRSAPVSAANLPEASSDTAPLETFNKGLASSAQSPRNLEDLQNLLTIKTDNLEKKQNDIMDQNNKILDSIQFMSGQYEDFLKKIRDIELRNEELTTKNTALEARIIVLENGLEFQERALKANNLEIRGIPEIKGEILQDVLFNICQKTKSTIQTKDIEAIYRSAKKNNNNQSRMREIIVKLKSNLARNQLLADVKSFNKNNPNVAEKLNTSNIGFAGPCSPIYVSEQLTFRTKQIWYKTRHAAKDKQYRFAWVKGGKCYVRKEMGTNAICISDESKLAAL